MIWTRRSWRGTFRCLPVCCNTWRVLTAADRGPPTGRSHCCQASGEHFGHGPGGCLLPTNLLLRKPSYGWRGPWRSGMVNNPTTEMTIEQVRDHSAQIIAEIEKAVVGKGDALRRMLAAF